MAPTPDLPSPAEARRLYAGLVETTTQADPMMIYVTRDEVIPTGIVGVGPDTPLQLMLPQVIAAVGSLHGQPKWLLLSFEGWIQEKSLEEANRTRPGDVAKRGHAGDPDVKDAVMIYACSMLELWASVQPFVRGHVGKVAWGKATIEHRPVGPITEAMTKAVRNVY
jgi:hypothetical protein